MRILYFTRDYTPHDHRFLTSLVGAGQEVYYLRLERSERSSTWRPLPPEVRQIAWRGGQQAFRWRDLPALLFSLRGVLRQVRPDILHAGPIQTAAFLGALSGFRPLVSMSWGSDLLRDADRSRWFRWITRWTLERSTVLVGDCRAVQQKAGSFGFPAGRTYIFPWGIDLGKFCPENAAARQAARKFRARLGWQDKFVVLSLRSWEPVYGIDVMLRGFAQAAGRSPEMRLLMLGGGSQAGMVHRFIQQHGLADRVYLGGQVKQDDLPRMYLAADVYLSASHSDGSSVSLMEALGSGLPVLLSDIPSNREWVEDGTQGWLFPDGSDQALAQKLLYAMARREERAEMGVQARLRAEERADWNKNFRVLLRAYEAAVRGPEDQ